jgi:hypothetical protein
MQGATPTETGTSHRNHLFELRKEQSNPTANEGKIDDIKETSNENTRDVY